MTLKPFRRVVTGHDGAGRAIIQSDAPPTRVQVVGRSGPTFYEVWNTRETPALIDRDSAEPAEAQLMLAPPSHGTRIRVLDIPPETEEIAKIDAAAAREHFALVGAAEASTHGGGQPRHPFMHRTQSIDYGIVLEGEITLLDRCPDAHRRNTQDLISLFQRDLIRPWVSGHFPLDRGGEAIRQLADRRASGKLVVLI